MSEFTKQGRSQNNVIKQRDNEVRKCSSGSSNMLLHAIKFKHWKNSERTLKSNVLLHLSCERQEFLCQRSQMLALRVVTLYFSGKKKTIKMAYNTGLHLRSTKFGGKSKIPVY